MIKLFYRPEMAPPEVDGFSKSPTKPRRFVEFLRETPVWPHVEVTKFPPLGPQDLLSAHTLEYVDAFFDSGKQGGGIPWTPAFAVSVLYTTGSLVAATRAAVDDPSCLTMAPVSGFHHAGPDGGAGFCTFSGQVIAALKLYRERGLVGAWVDLDGHFGNSIEDSRDWISDLSLAIPLDCNINPKGNGQKYLDDLADKLAVLEGYLLAGTVHYVCFAHGADSHEWDDLGGQVSTEQWLTAADLVYRMVQRVEITRKRPVPLTLALFGGYRDDDPDSVLGLHAMSVARALAILEGHEGLFEYAAEVKKPVRPKWAHFGLGVVDDFDPRENPVTPSWLRFFKGFGKGHKRKKKNRSY